ncbi:MAG TPA: helix-turn-helix domain-containing protein, partial [Actinomycetota bacterium]
MRIRTPADIARAVREARMVERLTQADLADTIGVSRAWVIRLERGAPGIQLGKTLWAMQSLGLHTTVRFSQLGEPRDLETTDGFSRLGELRD